MVDEPDIKGRVGGARWFGAICISLILVGAVVWYAEPSEIWRVLGSASALPLGLAVAHYVAVLFLRWIRLSGLTESGGFLSHRLELLWASAGHSFATQLLPARSGELVFPALWKKATGEGYGDGAVYLLAIRVVELCVLVPLYALALLIWLGSRGGGVESIWLVAIVDSVALLMLFGLPWLLRFAFERLDWLLLETRLADIELLEPLREAVPEAHEAIDRLGLAKQSWLVGTTLLMWLAMFGVFYWVTVACGANVGVVQSVVGAGGGIVGNLLPIGGIGSLGTMEAGWTAAFLATGAAKGPIVAAGLLLHAIVIAGTGLITGLTHIWLEIENRFH